MATREIAQMEGLRRLLVKHEIELERDPGLLFLAPEPKCTPDEREVAERLRLVLASEFGELPRGSPIMHSCIAVAQALIRTEKATDEESLRSSLAL
jgi:hypothetical protein